MEDEELLALKKLKEELLAKANNLISKLKEQERDQQIVTLKLPSSTKNGNNEEEQLLQQYDHRLCELSRQVSGITFENIDRKWLCDNTYQYTTFLITKVLKLNIELTVILKDEKGFEISDITCHFINIDKCYMAEIQTWVQNLTRMKNFSLLTSAISQYNEQSQVRQKILNNSRVVKYTKYEPCTENSGGLLIYVHSTKNEQLVYLKFQWSLLFLELTWQIEHYFVIDPTETGLKFAEENESLIKKLCIPNISKLTLIDLWSQLCSAIDKYEDKNKM